ncbi:kelch-like ECH-associated protein 1 [Hydra vulgaris]|nr:kelch-like ECH-associated protein 1 [Hydra vulgaris]
MSTECHETCFDISEQHHKLVFLKLPLLKKDKFLCDTTLVVGRKKIYAHKILLACSVPYFYSMFNHDVVESRQNVITLKDLDPESVESIIDFVYTSKIVITQRNVQAILQVATMFQINLIQEKCCDFLESQLHPSNGLGIYLFAELYGCSKLKSRAKTYCNWHFSDVVREDEFLNLSLEQVKWFLNQDELCVRSETEVFNAAIRWVSQNSQQRKKDLQYLLPLVRFNFLPKSFLSLQLETNDLIMDDEFSLKLLFDALNDIEVKQLVATKRKPIGNNVVFYMGGYNRKSFASYGYFNPETETWFKLGDMCSPRSGAGCVSLGGLIYMVGGRTNSLQGKSDSNSVECYDPYSQEWKNIASLNSSRHRLGVAAVDGVIYAFGGSDGMVHLNTVEKYDSEKNLWEPAPSMNTPRIGVGGTVLNGVIYAVGGFDSENRLQTVESYMVGESSWKFLASLNTPRSGAGVTSMNGHVYAVGGYNGVAQLNSVERYCPYENRWTNISSMNERRSALSVAVVRNKLFAFGGYDGERFLDSVEVYDPDNGEWQLLNPMPDARSGAGVAVCIAPII